MYDEAKLVELLQDALTEEDREKMLTRLNEIEDEFPGHPAILHQRGMLLRSMEKYSKAYSDLLNVVETFPEDASARSDIAMLLVDMENLEDSIAHLDKAIELEPENMNYRYNRAISMMNIGRAKEGTKELKMVLDMDPGYSLAYLNLSIHYSEEDLFELAMRTINRGISKAEHPALFLQRGMLHYESKNYLEAIADYSNCMEDLWPSYEALQRLAELYVLVEQYDKALLVIDDLVENFPDEDSLLAEMYYLKSLCFISLGDDYEEDFEDLVEYLVDDDLKVYMPFEHFEEWSREKVLPIYASAVQEINDLLVPHLLVSE